MAVAALAAMVSLIGSDSDPWATVLVWALGLVLVVIVLNLAWTFPVFRGLAFKTQDRFKAWRARRRLRRWIATVYISTEGIEFDLSAPPDSTLEDKVTVDLTRRSGRYTKTVKEPAIEFDTKRATYSAMYPSDFANAPTTPSGRALQGPMERHDRASEDGPVHS